MTKLVDIDLQILSWGGRVGVESIPSQGSKFWIELPKVAEETNPREEKVA